MARPSSPPEQPVVLLVSVSGDVDGCFILLHEFQEFTGVQARVTVIKVLEGDEEISQESVESLLYGVSSGLTAQLVLFVTHPNPVLAWPQGTTVGIGGSDQWAPKLGSGTPRGASKGARTEAIRGFFQCGILLGRAA